MSNFLLSESGINVLSIWDAIFLQSHQTTMNKSAHRYFLRIALSKIFLAAKHVFLRCSGLRILESNRLFECENFFSVGNKKEPKRVSSRRRARESRRNRRRRVTDCWGEGPKIERDGVLHCDTAFWSLNVSILGGNAVHFRVQLSRGRNVFGS